MVGGLNAGERYVIMSEKSSARYGSWFQAWIGLGIGVCIVIPVLAFLGWANFRKSQRKQDFDGFSGE